MTVATLFVTCWLCYMCAAFDLQGWTEVSNTASMNKSDRFERIVLKRTFVPMQRQHVPEFPCAAQTVTLTNPYPGDGPHVDPCRNEWCP